MVCLGVASTRSQWCYSNQVKLLSNLRALSIQMTAIFATTCYDTFLLIFVLTVRRSTKKVKAKDSWSLSSIILSTLSSYGFDIEDWISK